MVSKKEPEEVIVHAGFAYARAIEALDIVFKLAKKRDDTDTLLSLAAVWVEIGGHLAEGDGIIPSSLSTDGKDTTSTLAIGFAPQEVDNG